MVARYPVELELPTGIVKFNEKPLLMGIVNVTPDSFSDGGQYLDPARAIAHGEELVAQGADWLDIGAESTRPGASPVGVEEESRRALPVVEGLAQRVPVPLSIDTYKAEVARRAIAAGASIINDVTGFVDPAMIALAASTRAACVCMHMRGTPATMRELADYTDVMATLHEYFTDRLDAMDRGGIARQRIMLDPGFGFAKRTTHNLTILQKLAELHTLGRPLLVGVSRKRIIGDLTGQPENARLVGTIAASLAAYYRGAHVLRIHDVAAMRDAIAVVHAIEHHPG